MVGILKWMLIYIPDASKAVDISHPMKENGFLGGEVGCRGVKDLVGF